ncbi:hypothetical protein [Photobacterium sp. 53610]|uniref:hypothetical protein n=1 Tax=Photobacterium sp. 53610 TaxID=3102789 RepID=UPI002ED9E203
MGSPAEKLLQTQKKIRNQRQPHLVPVPSAPRSYRELQAHHKKQPVKSGAEHLAEAKALFKQSHARSRVKMAYESLTKKQRGLVLIAGGLSPHDFNRNFDDFSDQERQKIRAGLLELNTIDRQFENTVGNVQNLKPQHFH